MSEKESTTIEKTNKNSTRLQEVALFLFLNGVQFSPLLY